MIYGVGKKGHHQIWDVSKKLAAAQQRADRVPLLSAIRGKDGGDGDFCYFFN